jgi:hypothetical protein
MKRFDSKGMLVIPNPMQAESICKNREVLIVKACHCPNGHDMVSSKAIFNGFNGIVFRVKRGEEEGIVALSPVYGYKSRVSLNVELKEGQIWKVYCPVCDTPLPVYSECQCGGDVICLFLDKEKDFNNCIGICNRIGCGNAGIKFGDEIMWDSLSMATK